MEEIKAYYNIVEPYHSERDVGEYFTVNGIKYDISIWPVSAHQNFNKVTTIGEKFCVLYTARLTNEEACYIALAYPGIYVYQPTAKEDIATMAKRVTKNNVAI